MKQNSRTRRRAFTLVEIMIVVAIIGMLATIAVPNYVKTRETARATTCLNNLQQIDGAVQEWALENKKDSGSPVTYRDIVAYLKGAVVCPSGGTRFDDSYALSAVDTAPTCLRRPSVHQLPAAAAEEPPSAPASPH